VCTVKKAIILIVLGKAEVIETRKQKCIRTVSRAYPSPNVIRLNNYIRVPYREIILTRKNIFKRDGYRCCYCGRGDLPLTIDHVVPKSRGGQDMWDNLVAACIHCNNKKGNRLPKEANLTLRTKPYTPNYVLFIKNTVNRIDETWKPFLFQK